jgi:hypothetical protein
MYAIPMRRETIAAPSTFTVRPLTPAEIAAAGGGAAYLKLGDIEGASTASLTSQNNLKQLALAAH